MTRLPLTALLTLSTLLFALPASAQEPPLRTEVVKVHHIDVHDAEQVLRAIVSRRGRLDANRELGVLTIVDEPALVDKMIEILSGLDQPRPQLEFTVFMVVAGEKQRRDGEMDFGELNDVMTELRRLFSYDSYRILDRGAVRLIAGNEARLRVGGSEGWDLELSTRGATDGESFGVSLHLYVKDVIDSGGEVTVLEKTVVATSLEVRDGQTTVVGASKLDGDDRALITILRTRVIAP